MSKIAPWTAAEIALIREHFPHGGAKACAGHLPGRSLQSIRKKASECEARKLTKSGEPDGRLQTRQVRHWTGAEEALLRKVYHHKPPAELVALFGRTFKSIAGKANSMGLGRPIGPRTPQDDSDDVPLPAMDLLDSLACIRLRNWAHDCANTEADLRPSIGLRVAA